MGKGALGPAELEAKTKTEAQYVSTWACSPSQPLLAFSATGLRDPPCPSGKEERGAPSKETGVRHQPHLQCPRGTMSPDTTSPSSPHTYVFLKAFPCVSTPERSFSLETEKRRKVRAGSQGK